MLRQWKIVLLVAVFCLTLCLVYFDVQGRLLSVIVRAVEAVGRLGRR